MLRLCQRGPRVRARVPSFRLRSSPLARAALDRRILITHDKDFGELAFHWGLPADCGILLLRVSVQASEHALRRMVDLVESRVDWAGHFAVATEDRIRMKPLPREGTGQD